ncbi:MAG: hypothetical protein SGI92_17410, partial [Bryobacteraceae bacterium]|nr:hypothetical protein [Bryobacteraceae bacterium]
VEKSLGTGNGDGKAQAGETIVIAVPDGEAFRAAELFSSDSCVDLTTRLSDTWRDYDYVGATGKTSLAHIRKDCPTGHEIPLFVRYQLPDKPDHILKEGTVVVRVAGPS